MTKKKKERKKVIWEKNNEIFKMITSAEKSYFEEKYDQIVLSSEKYICLPWVLFKLEKRAWNHLEEEM